MLEEQVGTLDVERALPMLCWGEGRCSGSTTWLWGSTLRGREFLCLFSCRFQLLILLPFHPSVLKPNLYLAFRKTQAFGDFASSRTAEVFVEVKLLLQLKQLSVRVACPIALAVPLSCNNFTKNMKKSCYNQSLAALLIPKSTERVRPIPSISRTRTLNIITPS